MLNTKYIANPKIQYHYGSNSDIPELLMAYSVVVVDGEIPVGMVWIFWQTTKVYISCTIV